MQWRVLIAWWAMGLGVAACSGAGPNGVTAMAGGSASVPATNPASRALPVAADATLELRAEVLRLIGPAACRSDSDCRALPLGAKPCGGPETYLAWSTLNTDMQKLKVAAERYRAARDARNQQLGLMSDCALVTEPAVRCVVTSTGVAGGRCEAAPAGRGGPAPVTR